MQRSLYHVPQCYPSTRLRYTFINPQMFTKLLGTTLYQIMRIIRSCMRCYCLACCYRVEFDATERPRIVCCSRPGSYYGLDDLWESEHPYVSECRVQ